MSSLRSLQRGVIKHQCYKRDGHTKAFKDEWEKIHYGKEVTDNEKKSVKSKKSEKTKQKHFDDGKSLLGYLKAARAFADSVKNKNGNSNTSAREKVC